MLQKSSMKHRPLSLMLPFKGALGEDLLDSLHRLGEPFDDAHRLLKDPMPPLRLLLFVDPYIGDSNGDVTSLKGPEVGGRISSGATFLTALIGEPILSIIRCTPWILSGDGNANFLSLNSLQGVACPSSMLVSWLEARQQQEGGPAELVGKSRGSGKRKYRYPGSNSKSKESIEDLLVGSSGHMWQM